MTDPRLVIFDVDGTLVDSRNEIMASMQAAYAAQGLPIGVSWGYHPVHCIGADITIDDFAHLPGVVAKLMEPAA